MTQISHHGWILIDKPEGLSSAATLNHIKKYFVPGKIGHAGTLDPFATGVLLVAVGEATKLMPYVMSADKSYEFEVFWGEGRDTLDITGEVVATSARIPTQESIEEVIPKFLGDIMQEPPQFSAIKVNGRRAYFFARNRKKVSLSARPIHIHELKLLAHEGNISRFFVSCTKGTYVRAIARDLADSLGSCAYVSKLNRVTLGKFTLGETIPLATLAEMLHNGTVSDLANVIMPIDSVLDGILVQQVGDLASRHLQHGRRVALSEAALADGLIVAAKYAGRLIAICQHDGGFLQPLKVFNL